MAGSMAQTFTSCGSFCVSLPSARHARHARLLTPFSAWRSPCLACTCTASCSTPAASSAPLTALHSGPQQLLQRVRDFSRTPDPTSISLSQCHPLCTSQHLELVPFVQLAHHCLELTFNCLSPPWNSIILLCARICARNPPAIPPPLGAIASSGVATSTRQCAPPHCPGLARPP